MWWFILFLIFLVGCSSTPVSEIVPVTLDCTVDSDCARAGCSGQLCTSASLAKDTVTTCEFRDEYVCYQQATCGCVEGRCNWKEDISSCLAEYS